MEIVLAKRFNILSKCLDYPISKKEDVKIKCDGVKIGSGLGVDILHGLIKRLIYLIFDLAIKILKTDLFDLFDLWMGSYF